MGFLVVMLIWKLDKYGVHVKCSVCMEIWCLIISVKKLFLRYLKSTNVTKQEKDSTDHIWGTVNVLGMILCFKFELTMQLHTFQHSLIVFCTIIEPVYPLRNKLPLQGTFFRRQILETLFQDGSCMYTNTGVWGLSSNTNTWVTWHCIYSM